MNRKTPSDTAKPNRAFSLYSAKSETELTTPDPRAIWESLSPAQRSMVTNGCAERPAGDRGEHYGLVQCGILAADPRCRGLYRMTDLGRAVALAGSEGGK